MSLESFVDAVASHALAVGVFDAVNGNEPKTAPGQGITAAVWLDRIEPVKSGLKSTSVRLVFNIRLYTNMLAEPQDMIDVNLIAAVDILLEAYSGDFTLNDTIRSVDLLGATGAGLSAQAGYIDQDNKKYRVVTVTLPLIVNDVWDQVA